MKRMCCARYEQEATEQEYQRLKKRLGDDQQEDESILTLFQPHGKAFEQSIPNTQVRELFLRDCYASVKQTRTDLYQSYLQIAEQQRQHFSKQYQAEYQQLKAHEREGRISTKMVQLIMERSTWIAQRLQQLYKDQCAKD